MLKILRDLDLDWLPLSEFSRTSTSRSLEILRGSCCTCKISKLNLHQRSLQSRRPIEQPSPNKEQRILPKENLVKSKKRPAAIKNNLKHSDFRC